MKGAPLKYLTASLAFAVVSCSSQELEIRTANTSPSWGASTAELVHQAQNQFKLGNYALASEGFRKAIRQNPDLVVALNGLAASYDRMGRFDLSRRYYELALAVSPNEPRVLHNLSVSERLQHRVQTLEAAAKQETRNDFWSEARGSELAKGSQPRLKLERISLGEVRITTTIPKVKADTVQQHSYTAPVRKGELTRRDSSKLSFHFKPIAKDLTLPIQVLNAVGRKGQALRLRNYLNSNGWSSVSTADAARRRSTSLVLYPPRLASAAREFSAQLPFSANTAPSARVDRIVLLIGSNAVAFDNSMLKKT